MILLNFALLIIYAGVSLVINLPAFAHRVKLLSSQKKKQQEDLAVCREDRLARLEMTRNNLKTPLSRPSCGLIYFQYTESV